MTVSKCCLIKLLPYILFEKNIFIFWHWKRQATSTVPVVSAHFRSLYRPSYVRRSDCWDACFRPHRMHRVDAACLYTRRTFRCPCVCVCVCVWSCLSVYVGHTGEPCVIGWTDPGAVSERFVWALQGWAIYWMVVHIGAFWRIRLYDPCAEAMGPRVKLLWPFVGVVLALCVCVNWLWPWLPYFVQFHHAIQYT